MSISSRKENLWESEREWHYLHGSVLRQIRWCYMASLKNFVLEDPQNISEKQYEERYHAFFAKMLQPPLIFEVALIWNLPITFFFMWK